MSNNEFAVTAYDPAVHKPALLEFLSAVYPPDVLARRELVMDWVERHPHRDRQPLRYVVMDGDRVAATMGHLPCDFRVEGRTMPARFTHDLLVDPTYRGMGLAKLIVNNAIAQGEFLPGGMWMTGPCYKIHLACGFEDAPRLVVRTLVLDPDEFTRRKAFSGIRRHVGNAAFSALRRRALVRAGKATGGALTCDDVSSFDSSDDDTWRALLESYRVTMLRDAAHLNWKYMQHPVLDYRASIARREGKTVGYVVWRRPWQHDEEKRAVITDVLVANGDAGTFEQLVGHVVQDTMGTDAAVISALSSQPWASKTLRGFGFLPRQESHEWVVGNWKALMPVTCFADARSWHMCMGDSDGDLWTGSA